MSYFLDALQTLVTCGAVVIALRVYLENLIDRQTAEARLVYALPTKTTQYTAPVTTTIRGDVDPVEGMSTGPTMSAGQWHITEDVIVYEVTVHNDSKEVMNRLDLRVKGEENDYAIYPTIPYIEPGGTRAVTVAARMYQSQMPRVVRPRLTFHDSSGRRWMREIDRPLYSTRPPWYRSRKGSKVIYEQGRRPEQWWPIRH